MILYRRRMVRADRMTRVVVGGLGIGIIVGAGRMFQREERFN